MNREHNRIIKLLFLITFLSILIFNNCLNNKLKEFNLNKIRNYLNFCIQMSTNKIQFSINYHYIDISVIIPVYNSQKTITKSIISIQNQKKPTYEIILINDCSSDNSKRIIENLKIKDSRIKIINNRKNMGTLYSRCIGVLFSKGKYIFPLDNDDMFLENIFWSIYKEAYNNDYDIVGFKALRGNSYYSQIKEMYDDPLHMHRNGLIVYQPELSHFSLLNKECHIWGKSIKAKI